MYAIRSYYEKEVARGTFREDLYYRLNVISLHLPPLRERPEDIIPLAEHFLDKMVQKTRKPLRGIAQSAMEALSQYRWPGNVRELENVIERAVILALGHEITLDLLPLRLSTSHVITSYSIHYTKLYEPPLCRTPF